MKVLVCAIAGTMMVGPLEKGTGVYAFGLPYVHNVGFTIPQGGSGVLSEVLKACIEDNGGTVITSSQVNAVKVEAGEAKRVILDNGEEIAAKKAIVSAVNVKQLFLEMLDPEELPPGFQDKVRRLKHSPSSCMRVNLAINESVKYKAGGDLNETLFVHIYPLMEEYLQVYEGFARGIPNTQMLELSALTLLDPTRAPEGKHTLGIYHLEPYNLRDGGPAKWDEIKQEIANDFLETLRSYTTNMGDENILGRWISTPLDYERRNPAFMYGDIHHLDSSLSQFFGNRPLPGWGHYRTPVKKLYMCGASTHPAGGVTGGSRAAVRVIMEDFGIDFRKVIPK